MLKIEKNAWIVYNKDGSLVTIEIYNRDSEQDVLKSKGYEKMSIVNDEYDNADYVLSWNVWNNKNHITNEQIKQSIGKRLGLKDFVTLKYKTSIFSRVFDNFLVVGNKLFEHGHNDEVIDLVYNTICSHFDKSAHCWQYRYQNRGYTYCTREQAKQVLETFKQMENSENNEEEKIF